MTTEHDTTPPESLLSAQAVRAAFDTPWKASNEIIRLMMWPLIRLTFMFSGVAWGSGWRLYGLPIIQKHRRSTMTIGARLNLRSTARSNPLGPNRPVVLSTRRPGAVLTIGDDFGMTGGSIVCEERITIGNRVTVGANSIITDTDFHPLDARHRFEHPLDGATAPVIIEDDVFIGMQVLILKGVTIGAASVVGAGSVVTRDVPPAVIAAGNPARVIGELSTE
ncbi:MAG: acyltransferase [Chloroflexi bacterium]|nr:MAG: acyltransferase [Chloroflexota bacterium]